MSDSLFSFDRGLGARYVCGADEAGCACWAGPLVAAAVRFDYERLGADTDAVARLADLNDSKQLSSRRRAALLPVIFEVADMAVSVVIPAGQIDRDGMHVSNMRALGRALEAVAVGGSVNLVDGSAHLVDGFELRDVGVSPRLMVRGDQTSAAIAAASIVAKETRDQLMRGLDVEYPGFGFAVHKGYGTAAHAATILELGRLSPAHRRSVHCKAYAALGAAPGEGKLNPYRERVVLQATDENLEEGAAILARLHKGETQITVALPKPELAKGREAAASRSLDPLTAEDIERLVVLERAERERLYKTGKVWAAHKDRLLCVALAQGAAQHLLDGTTGVKDLDVWAFFARRPDLPSAVVDSGFRGGRHRDFGPSHLGGRDDPEFRRRFPRFVGRNVDLFGVAIPADPSDVPAEAVRSWLSAARTSRARYLAEKAVVMLEPRRLEIVWPAGKLESSLEGFS